MIAAYDVDNPHLLAILEATAPPGVRVLLAGDDPTFVKEIRTIFDLCLPEDLVIMASVGFRRVYCVLPPTSAPGLALTFTLEADDEICVTPALLTTSPYERAAWRFSTQAVIDAWQSLLFRRVAPTEGVQ
jgi:hypothetical protein